MVWMMSSFNTRVSRYNTGLDTLAVVLRVQILSLGPRSAAAIPSQRHQIKPSDKDSGNLAPLLPTMWALGFSVEKTSKIEVEAPSTRFSSTMVGKEVILISDNDSDECYAD